GRGSDLRRHARGRRNRAQGRGRQHASAAACARGPPRPRRRLRRRAPPEQPRGTGGRGRHVIWAKLAVAALAWLSAAPLPQPRTEVGAAVLRGEIVVVGGLTAEGVPSGRADAFSPATGRWRRLPGLPVAVHHPLVAS